MGHGKPRVIFVSTYPPEPCGIGHVTHELVQALGSLRDVSVIGNIPSNAPPVEGAVTREWRKNEILYPVKILNGVDRASDGPDTIVHVQHHFNLYGGAISVALFPVLILLPPASWVPGCRPVPQRDRPSRAGRTGSANRWGISPMAPEPRLGNLLPDHSPARRSNPGLDSFHGHSLGGDVRPEDRSNLDRASWLGGVDAPCQRGRTEN